MMTGLLRISISARPSHVLVSLAGECDTTTAPQLLAALTQIPLDKRRVVIDLSSLSFIDAAGIHALLNAREALTVHERFLVLGAPQPIVARVLEITGADQLIPLYERVAKAIAPD